MNQLSEHEGRGCAGKETSELTFPRPGLGPFCALILGCYWTTLLLSGCITALTYYM